MGVQMNGKEVSKEEFKELLLKRKAQYDYIKKKSKTYLGREELRRKGIEPITD